MTSPLLGVWELVSDKDKGLRIFVEGNNATVIIRGADRRRGFISVYSVQGNRMEANILIDTATTAPPTGTLEFERDGDTLTLHALTPGAIAAAGQVDVWRKVSDLQMTSPVAGVWQLISETDHAIAVRTDTHWAIVSVRDDLCLGWGGSHTTEGNHTRHTVPFATLPDASSQFDVALQREEETLTVSRLTGSTGRPVGHVDQWRKID